MTETVPAIVPSNGGVAEASNGSPLVGGQRAAPANAESANRAVLTRVAEQIRNLREQLAKAEALWAPQIAAVEPSNRASAVNLVHYWAIRQHDLRDLQTQLAAFGLSSLGRSEPHVQATLEAIAATVDALTGVPAAPRDPVVGFGDGPRLLRRRATELLGSAPAHRQTRIMVTLPPEAATDPKLVQDFVEHGMELARVNCAHDDPAAWAGMIGHVRAAAAATGRDCKVAMDLPGPKLRTGPLAPGPQVIKIKPTRDLLGVVIAAGRAWLTAAEDPQPAPRPGVARICVPRTWLARLEVKDSIELTDTRQDKRHLHVDTVDECGVLVSTGQTTYLATGTELRTRKGHRASVTGLPALERFLTLHVGDELVLTRDCSPAPMPTGDTPAQIGCTLPEAFGTSRSVTQSTWTTAR
jgi:pyruvate kinase